MAKTKAELLLEELDLEKDSIDVGIERYRRTINKAVLSGNESTTGYGFNIINGTVDVIAEGVSKHIKASYLGLPGHLASSSKLLIQLPPEISAYMGLKVTIDNLSTPMGMTNVAVKIGQHIEDEVRFLKYKKENPLGFKRVKDEVVERTSNRNNRRIAINYTMKFKHGVEHIPWDKAEHFQVGQTLVHLITKTGLVRQQKVGVGGGKTKILLQPTEETLKWLEKANATNEMLSPIFQPMVHPPKEWTSLFNGGYFMSKLRRNRLIKASNSCYLEELKHDEMPLVYNTTNALGATCWKVDEDILEVVKVAWEQGWDADLPSKDPIEIPPSPFANKELKKAEMTADQRARLKAWAREAAKIHNKNAKSISKKLRLIRTIQTAEKFKGRGIYFPHSRCFRGRLYPIPSFLSYQSESYAKSLLRFNEELPIDTLEQLNALKKHGANCIGYDKHTLGERLNVIDELNEEIIAWATDPYTNRGWLDADSPWESLQFAYEWKGFSEKGYGFMSSLCISVDGSINGSQHCSAILRDPIGARATNLENLEKPSDLYQILADDLKKRLSERTLDTVATKWLESGFLNRKLVKRPVMTRAYSSTKQSCREYLEEYVVEQRLKGNQAWEASKDFEYCVYLCEVLWEEMAERLKGQTVFMLWLKDIVEIYVQHNIPFTWQVPNGFIAFQRYTQMSKSRIKTTIDGSFYRGVLNTPNEKKSCRRRNKQGCAPNVIHSLDAAHLDLTVNNLLKKHPDMSFGMVHDSFGCHVARMPEMLDEIRGTFAEMYQKNNIIQQIYDDCFNLFGDVTPPPPEIGDFDITKVLRSDYFFS